MNFETVKTLKGEFVVILEETKDGGYLCVYPKGEQIILAPTELDQDSFSEYSEDDMRVTIKQRQALKNYFPDDFSKVA
ncbi:MAG: hypothetical protein CME70_20365 [Halobacteriovorax sp.]|nr:hypothetical protein [Halobacteriovorax sp.]|tara:strand:- start:57824 stop:58057 length:234 start_codon:yes stop_codon:yes gene_type:complete